MRKSCITWLLMAVLAAVLLAGCAGNQEETTPTQPDINAGAAYAAAKKAVEASENLILEYTLRETRKVGENTFTEHVTGKASYTRYGGQDMTAVVEEELDFGVYSCTYAESYCEKKAYALINDCRFWSNLSAEEFIARQLPPVLLTPALYNRVTCGEDGKILFSQPRALEAWVGEGQLVEAAGSAALDGEGNLLWTDYQVQYRRGAAEYVLEITLRVTMPERLDLSGAHLAHGQTSKFLSCLDAPRKLVQVVADVYAAQTVKCELAETITSEAIPLSYSRSCRVLLKGQAQNLRCEVLNESRVSNNRGTVTENSQVEQFQNGEYTLSVNGSEPARNGSVTAEAMGQYAEDTVLSGLLAVKYLQNATAQGEGRYLRLELSGNESYRKALAQQLMGVLQVDLDAQAESARTFRSGGYLTVDLETALPVAMGMYLERSHTIDGVAYRLDYRLRENLSFVES